ncbi:MAG TPA: hypothetical protein VM737_04860 [Gemmatimonadota bacterium]|nr:hypothetical protein [Gemmatimonadota bacterium]
MKKIWAGTLVALLGAGTWVSPVRAQDGVYHPFELNVHVGSVNLDFTDEHQFMAGGRALFSLPNGLGVGGNIDWVNTELATVYLYSGEINLTIPMGLPADLILSAGIGAISISPEDEEDDEAPVTVEDETSTMVPLGVGVRWQDRTGAPPWIGYRFDLRDNVIFPDEDFDNNTHNWEFSGGVSLLF